MDFDFNFSGNEDFGLAKSFSREPIAVIKPGRPNAQTTNQDLDSEFTQCMQDEIRAEGFNFRIAPDQDVRNTKLTFLASAVLETA